MAVLPARAWAYGTLWLLLQALRYYVVVALLATAVFAIAVITDMFTVFSTSRFLAAGAVLLAPLVPIGAARWGNQYGSGSIGITSPFASLPLFALIIALFMGALGGIAVVVSLVLAVTAPGSAMLLLQNLLPTSVRVGLSSIGGLGMTAWLSFGTVLLAPGLWADARRGPMDPR